MHILFLTPQLPYPPRQGTSIRNYHLLAHLAQHHTIDLLTFLAPGDELLPESPLYRHCRRIGTVPQPLRSTATRLINLATSLLPDMALRLEAPAMHQLMQSWLADTAYEIVQIEGIELAQYAHHADLSQSDPSQSAVIFDDHNCEYLLQQRNALTDLRNPRRWHAAGYSLIQWAKLRRYEANVCRAADAVVAVSQPDRAALQRIAPQATIHLAPNGIDLATYTSKQNNSESTNRRKGHFTLLFTGKMDYRPNIDAVLWFAERVLPQIVAALPEVRFQIVGMNPHARLDPLRHHPNIEITGSVTDVTPYLHAADLYVIPMRVGGGTRFKALEAMAASKAIVSTSLGVEGIGVETEREMLLADSPADFAAAILRLVADQRAGAALSQRLGQAAHDFVAAHYTWEKIVPIFERLYANLQEVHNANKPRLLPTIESGTHHHQRGIQP
ncbi:MAG: glycosyltransferase [Caldilineaceae bacterium]|nr:glycosyltransferase [Caldilineaceae bacterium]